MKKLMLLLAAAIVFTAIPTDALAKGSSGSSDPQEQTGGVGGGTWIVAPITWSSEPVAAQGKRRVCVQVTLPGGMLGIPMNGATMELCSVIDDPVPFRLDKQPAPKRCPGWPKCKKIIRVEP